MQIDDVDRAILQELQSNGRLSLRKLAQRVHMTAPAVAERVHRLEDQQIIVGYTVQVDSSKFEPKLMAYIAVFLSKREGVDEGFLRLVEKREEVCECYRTVGDSCYLLKVAVSDHDHLDAFANALMVYGSYRVHLVVAEPLKKGRKFASAPILIKKPLTDS
ncbi:Lrp/AsnC family transcriptional regulator [Ktedonospora formicarum]|uniref:HTH-type transcriptional regulator LrpB n=1 Tax=Ktedonospora formicarum TaxID=2778364 RepID=A0A8J3IB02_9CHLR|nr:Lrp/AsnC family transcriptional regulator [Ktedonospora formicarum]GHO48993.1 HTH-type transcriptional regulator LrpB [Ktedonospora formicarum]